MPNNLDQNGLTTATYTELINYYTNALQTIYGSQVNLASDTPDGQWINIFIQAILDNEDLLTQIYNSFDPDNAIGVVLDQRCAINGVVRQAGTFTTTQVTLVVASNYTVNLYGLDQSAQPIYTVADSAGNQWQLITTQIAVAPGSHSLIFQAATPGAVLTTPNTITIPVTIVLGVNSINNPSTYLNLGVNEESDAKLKIRRLQSVAIPSQGYFQSLTAALENINGISSASVIENDTGGTVNSIPGHSIWVIVAGVPTVPLAIAYNALTTYSYGTIASSSNLNYISVANNNTGNSVSDPAFWQLYDPVAETIYTYRNAGCGMYNSGGVGAHTVAVIQIDGTAFNILWDTVVSQPLYMAFTARSLNGVNPPNLSAISSYLVSNFTPGASAEVNINELATLIQQADPNTIATFPSQGFSTSSLSGPFTFTKSPTAANYQFSVTAPNILMLPMIITCPNGVQVLTVQADGSYAVTNTSVSIAHGSNTLAFSILGGSGATTPWSVSGIGGTINSSTGVYTSPVSATGTDTVTYTDSLSHTQVATVTVT